MNTLKAATVQGEDFALAVAALMDSRQTILPKRLIDPGPDAMQLESIFKAASSAPDHGQLCPWRFILVPLAERCCLAETFADALQERDSMASEDEMSRAREKAYRAPLLMLMVVDTQCGDQDVDLNERLISAGCALQNMLLMATALGFGSALTSGKALKSTRLHTLFQLTASELALCFLSIGSVQSRKQTSRRPEISRFVSEFTSSKD